MICAVRHLLSSVVSIAMTPTSRRLIHLDICKNKVEHREMYLNEHILTCLIFKASRPQTYMSEPCVGNQCLSKSLQRWYKMPVK